MKKLAAFVLILAMLLPLAACGSQPDSTAQASGTGAEKLTVWCWDENFNIAAMNTAAEYYRAAGHENLSWRSSTPLRKMSAPNAWRHCLPA